jgi:small basic protein
MPIELHVYLHDAVPSGLDAKLSAISASLKQLLTQGVQMNAQVQAKLDTLAAEVAADRNVVNSAKTLLDGLSAQIAALKGLQEDPAALVAALDNIVAGIDANKQALADAIVANTPAA